MTTDLRPLNDEQLSELKEAHAYQGEDSIDFRILLDHVAALKAQHQRELADLRAKAANLPHEAGCGFVPLTLNHWMGDAEFEELHKCACLHGEIQKGMK